MIRSNSTSNVDLYQSELPQPQKEIVKRLRAFIARRYPELTESLKWHVPTYSLNGKNLLGLQDFTAHVNLNFFRGAQLHDARRILIGTGKLVRHMTFRYVADIDCGSLKEFIDQAIRLNVFGSGLQLGGVTQSMHNQIKRLAAWEDITPLARNEWICWIESARKAETRSRRIAWGCSSLKDGKRRPCCWPGCAHR